MKAILTCQSVALSATFTQAMKSIVRISIIPATWLLADIASDRSHIP
jgi:hypothetical protein